MANFPSASSQAPQKKDNHKIVYGILIGALVLSWAFFFYHNGQKNEAITQKETQITNVASARDSIKAVFEKISTAFDSSSKVNVQLEGSLTGKNNDIKALQTKIGVALAKKNTSDAELRKMMKEYNEKIASYLTDITKLKEENAKLDSSNKQLSTEKEKLTVDKKTLEDNLTTTQGEKKVLEDKVDVATTLHASNINVVAFDVKSNGKEKETTKATHASLFRISCNIDENRIAVNGKKNLYVIVTKPDGKVSGIEGTFTDRDGAEKSYTNKVEIDYEQGKIIPVSFNWKPGEKFVTGNYKIEIYNNGFKIGETAKNLRKGGLF